MTWEEILERLLAIQKARGLPANWVVESIEPCGHPPRSIWRKIAKALGYTQYWADWWKYQVGMDTEPDSTVLDWDAIDRLPKLEPPLKPPAPKPILKMKR